VSLYGRATASLRFLHLDQLCRGFSDRVSQLRPAVDGAVDAGVGGDKQRLVVGRHRLGPDTGQLLVTQIGVPLARKRSGPATVKPTVSWQRSAMRSAEPRPGMQNSHAASAPEEPRLDAYHLAQATSVLEVGCGKGTPDIEERPTPSPVGHGSRSGSPHPRPSPCETRRAGVELELTAGSATRYPVSDGPSIASIHAGDSPPHLAETRSMAAEPARVLTPGGEFASRTG
jgi:hypothetical protein